MITFSVTLMRLLTCFKNLCSPRPKDPWPSPTTLALSLHHLHKAQSSRKRGRNSGTLPFSMQCLHPSKFKMRNFESPSTFAFSFPIFHPLSLSVPPDLLTTSSSSSSSSSSSFSTRLASTSTIKREEELDHVTGRNWIMTSRSLCLHAQTWVWITHLSPPPDLHTRTPAHEHTRPYTSTAISGHTRLYVSIPSHFHAYVGIRAFHTSTTPCLHAHALADTPACLYGFRTFHTWAYTLARLHTFHASMPTCPRAAIHACMPPRLLYLHAFTPTRCHPSNHQNQIK